MEALTVRETEIIEALSQGWMAHEISEKFFISYHTVETHKKNAKRKLNAKTNAELVGKAMRMGKIS